MSKMFNLTGKLIYDPVRDDLRRKDQSRTLILDIETEEMVSYYYWFLSRKYGSWLKLQPPMFGTHVKVIYPREVPVEPLEWRKYEGRLIKISYSPELLERHWEFWSFTIFSKELVDIRRELGLETNFRLHLTIGRQFDWQPRENIIGVNHDTDYLDFEPN